MLLTAVAREPTFFLIPLARAAGDLTRAARDGFLNLQPHPPAFAALAARKPPPRSARTDVGWQDVMRTGVCVYGPVPVSVASWRPILAP